MSTKRLRRGKDWHGWAWKAGKEWDTPGELFYGAEPDKPSDKPEPSGKWVRVKFVEVKPRKTVPGKAAR